jgi:hypothetical protein
VAAHGERHREQFGFAARPGDEDAQPALHWK